MPKSSSFKSSSSDSLNNRARSIREIYLTDGRLPNKSDRSAIFRSWRRCQSIGVKSEIARPMSMLNTEALRLRCRQHNELLRAAAPLLAELQESLSDQGVIIHVADQDGIILDAISDSSTFEQAAEYGLVPGSDWSEISAGTNAIGTALAENSVMQVRGAEHFCEGPQHWSCIAAPVYYPDNGELLGAINISTLSDNDRALFLPLTTSLARNIERQLTNELQRSREHLLSHCLHRFEYCQGIILFDRNGRFVQANRQAAHFLKYSPIPRDPTINSLLPHADPLFKALDASWLEPLWLQGEIQGYLAQIPHSDRWTVDEPAGKVDKVGRDKKPFSYIRDIPSIDEGLNKLLRSNQQTSDTGMRPSRAAQLQQHLVSSSELDYALRKFSVTGTESFSKVFNSQKVLIDIQKNIPSNESERVDIHIDWPSSLMLKGDSRFFYQVITNLLDNSYAHGFESDRAGLVRIHGEVDGHLLNLEYQDNGQGMNESTLLQMEDPFFSTNGAMHFGLGSFINRLIVMRVYGGSVQNFSHCGRGLVCRIQLPVEAISF